MRTLARCIPLALVALSGSPVLADDAAPSEPPAEAPAPDKLRLTVDKAKIDLKNHKVEATLTRDCAKVDYKVTSEAGTVLAEGSVEFGGAAAGSPLVVGWTPSSDEPVAKIELKGHDTSGYWSAYTITAWRWSVVIPHQDVNFKSGSAKIEDSEKSKLEESYSLIADALKKYDKIGAITLYVAGHTDTVGRPADNLKLSAQRAQAIAAWFSTRGLTIPIAYEGFGESALLVKTADNVAEAKNRRVDYILALEEPNISATGFRPAWKRAK